MNFAFGSSRSKIISFRAPKNHVALYEKHSRCRRPRYSFRASVSTQAKTDGEEAAK
jgi:hypothetical protein